MNSHLVSVQNKSLARFFNFKGSQDEAIGKRLFHFFAQTPETSPDVVSVLQRKTTQQKQAYNPFMA